MILSRVADSLYWTGRYLERAENVTRLALVASELAVEIEGLDPSLAQSEWHDLLAAVPGGGKPVQPYGDDTAISVVYMNWLLLDAENPISVRNCMGRARENGRSVREALTREVFSNLNESYLALEDLRRDPPSDPVTAHGEVARTHRQLLTTLGSIENTLTRDQGWTFMKLGEAIERTRRTLLVLRSKLPALSRGSEERDLPLVYARWRGLLRSVASLENFRRVHGARLAPERVVRFLLFDRSAPRSARCGVSRIANYLRQLPGATESSSAERVIGKLLACLTYEDDRIMRDPDLTSRCDEMVEELTAAHDALARQYFPG
jgi:uncharacterized alpha-E superfamily protein